MREKQRIYRMLDANANRAVEGLRVVEDVLRFCRDEGALFRGVRALRHETRAAAAALPGGDDALLEARDSAADVGGAIPPRDKEDAAGMLRSNLRRAQEALRVLEETSAPLSPKCSKTFAEIRFKTYTMEKEIASAMKKTDKKIKKLPRAPFVYIIGGGDELTARRGEYLRAVLIGGAGVVQLREKDGMSDRDILKLAEKVRKAAEKAGALFFMNDRIDLALAAGADGVHLGDTDLPVSTAQQISDGLLIGVSSHSLSQALKAAEDGPDYIALGPIFPSPTKPDGKPVGLKTLEKVCCNLHIPVVAIGGITGENAREVFEAGASGAAIISSAREAKAPAEFIEKILRDAPEHKEIED